MNRFNRSTLTGLAMLSAFAICLGGCAKANVNQTMRAGPLPKPDMIIVQNFAVTPDEIKLDSGVLATAMRDAENKTPSDEESIVGHAVAEKLAQSLVEDLRKQGINAVRAGSMVRPTENTVILTGQFVTIDQGNQSERVWVGFGLGGSELRTRIQAVQGGQLVAEAETSTKAGMKPGMLVSGGASAAAGTGTALAVGAGTTAISETFRATVEADAARTAKQVAEKVHKAYVDRGWLAR